MAVAYSSSLIAVILRSDHALMRRIHHWSAPDWVRLVMVCASSGGDGWFWYALGFAILIFGDGSRFVVVCTGTAASGIGLVIYGLLKKVTRRKRPCLIEPHSWARMLPPDQYSFPSGHTIASFSSAISVGLFYPSLLPALLSCAILIAVSRIMLGMHFLSDVVVGALMGTSLGYSAYLFVR